MSLRTMMIFEVGSENAPDSRWGMDHWTFHRDGRFTYENRSRGHVLRTRTGRIEGSIVDQMARELEEAGFPSVPKHPMVPGGDYVRIIAKDQGGDLMAFMSGLEAERFKGYGRLLTRIAEWSRYLRADASTSLPTGLELDDGDAH